MNAPASRPLFDPNEVEQLLEQIAMSGQSISYSGLLLLLGHQFSRPKMRALCQVLDLIDEHRCASGTTPLAAFVVRKHDRLPGQGWWACRKDYAGPIEGPEAHRYLEAVQQAVTAKLQCKPDGKKQ